MLGYVKGKEDELSQHQLPPPCEVAEIYGSIFLVVHSLKTTWDSNPGFEVFTPSDYEQFYEKACSGDLDVDADAEDDVVDEEADEDEVVEEEEVVEEDDAVAGGDEDDALEEGEVDVDIEEEEAPRVRVSRRVIKIDPQQLQFQFKSVLVEETSNSSESVLQSNDRTLVFNACKVLLNEQCMDGDIRDLERGIFNAAICEAKTRMIPQTWEHTNFVWIYMMIAKRVVANFNPDSYVGNSHLISRWKEGEFTLDQIGKWSSYDLKPSQWKDLKDQQFRREKRILEGNLSMATDRFRCSGCHKKMCSYYELQTRSADEPMTIFIRCLNCGKQWKQ
jgi:DNA-directed RNA polymerase subunit M/transcription elongation factor TFIIS